MTKTHYGWTTRGGWVLIAVAFGCADRPSSSPTAPDRKPSAQYQIQGTVADKGGHPLPDALVTIVDGPAAGTSTRSDAAGKFELRGNSSGMATLRVSRDGFQTRTGTATWEPLGSVIGGGLGFVLDPVEPPISLESGTYTLTVAVDLANARDWKARPDAPCAGFPVDLTSRSYRAEIKEAARPGYYTHSVTAEDVTLRWHDLFAFFISGSYIGFDMEGGVGAGLYEDFPGFRYLEIGGHTNQTEPAVSSGSSVSIPFEGAISYCHLKSARGLNDDCYQVASDQILEYHVCYWDRATLVFTKR